MNILHDIHHATNDQPFFFVLVVKKKGISRGWTGPPTRPPGGREGDMQDRVLIMQSKLRLKSDDKLPK